LLRWRGGGSIKSWAGEKKKQRFYLLWRHLWQA